MQSYIKEIARTEKDIKNLSVDDLIARFSSRDSSKKVKFSVFLLLFILLLLGVFVQNLQKSSEDFVLNSEPVVSLVSMPLAATSSNKDKIVIPESVVKANPFLPYREIGSSSVNSVPQFDLIEPPESLNSNSEAARLMDTNVSGILYDKYNPSAILNIEGRDHLVKKGDVINGYKVLNIARDSVTVKLGENIYKAGIGEILTEGALNHNSEANLNKKFGGEK